MKRPTSNYLYVQALHMKASHLMVISLTNPYIIVIFIFLSYFMKKIDVQKNGIGAKTMQRQVFLAFHISK